MEKKQAKNEEETKTETQEEKTTETEEVKTEPLDKQIIYIEAERLERKRKELLEVEERIDKKMINFKQFVTNTEVQGKSIVTPPISDEDEKKNELNKILEGTGLTVD